MATGVPISYSDALQAARSIGHALLDRRGALLSDIAFLLHAAKYEIADSLVRSWVAAYQHHGSAGLVRQRNRYTREFKLEVPHRRAAENLSCRELEAIYNIGTAHSITLWQQQYERGELRTPLRLPSLQHPGKASPDTDTLLPASRISHGAGRFFSLIDSVCEGSWSITLRHGGVPSSRLTKPISLFSERNPT